SSYSLLDHFVSPFIFSFCFNQKKPNSIMAHYGIQAAVAAKTASKRSPNVEQSLLAWIFEVVGEKVPEGVAYEEVLKDGVVLCKLMNKIKPGAIDKAAQEYGVSHDQLFRTVDLFEKKNIPEVTAGIINLARVACSDENYKGPQLEKWVFANN
ncbi:Muscle-specific protein 20, partial [Sarcoptes scabiei]